ncbi:unnamed protein product [Cuscuta europaea]|uniref:Replication factor A C-terminal domain-containing protein n=1 Tax=Cuscuta europaea TaxID=41803 RepID=A0A9P0VN27_CUSEU|nr:unnamed protein product [Cuscuta europaea]
MHLYKNKLHANKCFRIKNFLVFDNYFNYKTTEHPYVLEFFKKTTVYDLHSATFPNLVFNFHQFDALQSLRVINDKLLIDVIGKYVGKTPVQTPIVNGKPEKLIELTLEDPDGNRIGCTLWNNYCKQFTDFYDAHNNEAIYIILQMGRPRRYQGYVLVGTSYDVSKLIINGSTPEFEDFKSQFGPHDDNTTMTTFTANSVGQGSEDVFRGKGTITNISDLLEEPHDETYWLLGDIVSLDNYKEWCYLSCPTCNKKIKPGDERFRCITCDTTIPEGVLRYKVSVCVMDDSGHATFTLWDRECIDIVGKTAAALRKEVEKKTGDPTHFPEDIEALIDQRGIFKIQIKARDESSSYKGPVSYGILAMIRDISILDLYTKNESHALEMDENTNVEKSGSTRNEIEDGTASSKSKQKTVLIEDDDFVSPTQVENKDDRRAAEKGKEVDCLETPTANRTVGGIEGNDQLKRNLNDQFSANVNIKRRSIRVKQEKE